VLTVHGEGLPTGQSCRNYLLVGNLYALSLDPETRLATWCCYRITKTSGETRNSIERNWINILPDVTLKASDYKGPRYDMGHLAPLAALKNSPFAYELNAMVNVAPQRPDLNRGPWVKIETQARQLAETHGQTDVIVGPLYELKMPPLETETPHKVPSHFWAILSPADAESKAYIVPQSCDRTTHLSNYAASINEITSRSGLTFPRKR
jgi:endonuclease G